MQVAHIILTDFKYEQDAFDRARQGFHEQFDSIVKGLESACIESLTYSLTGGDGRYCNMSCFMKRPPLHLAHALAKIDSYALITSKLTP